MDKFIIIKTLGQGTYGTVIQAQHRSTGQLLAIKKIKEKFNDFQECINLRQVKSLRKLIHPNIIKLKEVLKINDELNLVFQFLETNLYQLYSSLRHKGKRLSQENIKQIMHQITLGLSYMHKNGYFHRDLKPQNILISNDQVKIIDFGLAREIRSKPPFTDYVSTRWYRAPQLVFRSNNYNSPVDIFALGCIMAQLYMMEPLFPGNMNDQMSKIVSVLGFPSKQDWPQGYKLGSKLGVFYQQTPKKNLKDIIPTASPAALQLISAMLQFSPRKRPTAIDILRHSYFTQVDLQKQSLVLPQELKRTTDQERFKRKQQRQSQMRQTRKQKFFKSKKTQEGWIKPFKEQTSDVQDILKQLRNKKEKDSTPAKDAVPIKLYTNLKEKPQEKQHYYSQDKYRFQYETERTSSPAENKQARLQALAKAKLNFNFNPLQSKVEIMKKISYQRYQSLERERNLGQGAMNILRPNLGDKRQFKSPSVVNYSKSKLKF